MRCPALGRAGTGAAGAAGGGVAARHAAPGLRPPPVSGGEREREGGRAGTERSGAVRGAHPVSRRPEAEAPALRRLCRRARAGKEPAAARFYREEGNRSFGRRRYAAAARLYSQVRGAGEPPRGDPRGGGPGGGSPLEEAALRSPQAASHELPGSPEVSVCFANRSAALFHLGHFEVSGDGVAGTPPPSSCTPRGWPEGSRGGDWGEEEPSRQMRCYCRVFA